MRGITVCANYVTPAVWSGHFETNDRGWSDKTTHLSLVCVYSIVAHGDRRVRLRRSNGETKRRAWPLRCFPLAGDKTVILVPLGGGRVKLGPTGEGRQRSCEECWHAVTVCRLAGTTWRRTSLHWELGDAGVRRKSHTTNCVQRAIEWDCFTLTSCSLAHSRRRNAFLHSVIVDLSHHSSSNWFFLRPPSSWMTAQYNTNVRSPRPLVIRDIYHCENYGDIYKPVLLDHTALRCRRDYILPLCFFSSVFKA